MYTTSDLYKRLMLSPRHRFETSVVIGESGVLINEKAQKILFGGVALQVAQGGADTGFRESRIISLSTDYASLATTQPSVGGCVSAELSLEMFRPVGEIPRMALVAPYVRVTDGVDTSEWIPQGKFYIDTREYSNNDDGLEIVRLHCYDAMLMTEQMYPSTSHEWPVDDTEVVQEIAAAIGVGVDSRTWEVMTRGYSISTPAGYTMRETLANIAAMYAGNFVMNYDGELLLVALSSFPAETDYIINEYGDFITIGGDRLLVHFSQ